MGVKLLSFPADSFAAAVGAEKCELIRTPAHGGYLVSHHVKPIDVPPIADLPDGYAVVAVGVMLDVFSGDVWRVSVSHPEFPDYPSDVIPGRFVGATI